ncbi:hypothetical protein RFI_40155, partial [Reticulomyxa filosa]
KNSSEYIGRYLTICNFLFNFFRIAQKLFTEKRFQKEDRECRLEKALSEYTTKSTEEWNSSFIEVKRAVAERKEKKESKFNGVLKKCNKSLVDRCSDLNTDRQLGKKKDSLRSSNYCIENNANFIQKCEYYTLILFGFDQVLKSDKAIHLIYSMK